MRVCVYGLWHLGSVTAACLASVGIDTIGFDPSKEIISDLSKGRAPLFEPSLDELIKSGLKKEKLHFEASAIKALTGAQVVWVTFDTPVDNDDRADVDSVLNNVKAILPFVEDGAVILISSQLPVGSIRNLEECADLLVPAKKLSFACSPENLRLGKAIEVFLKPDRIIIGTRSIAAVNILKEMLAFANNKLEWMSVESAEMTKHAINAFLATSITFANEIAAICELTGADAKEVERGLKTESRIGPRAYLSPGGPFAGGTLARDIEFLGRESEIHQLASPLLSAVRPSNDEHKNWVRRKLLQQFDGRLIGQRVGIWGLTYKPGTDTLRRSLAVELCDWLLLEGAKVFVFDPAVPELPERWSDRVIRCANAVDVVQLVDALVIGTEWPEFKVLAGEILTNAKTNVVVIDANRHLQSHIESFRRSGITYIAVGTPLLLRR
jgi:UDPglucose 6-dehydrogenase